MQNVFFLIKEIVKLDNFPQSALSYRIFCYLNKSQNKVLCDWKEIQIIN